VPALPRRVVDIAVPLAVGALELVHPAGFGDQAVLAAAGGWIALHVALIVGYGLLVVSLWSLLHGQAGVFATCTRLALSLFFASNCLFLAIDGVGLGLAAQSAPAAAAALWTSPVLETLANVTGAAWALALVAVAAARQPVGRTPVAVAGMAITWLTFVAGSYLPGATLASRGLAVATGAWGVYSAGAGALPFGLLLFAAVLRQHVGPEAALGMLCIALARARQP
jgi:hypothetical protein